MAIVYRSVKGSNLTADEVDGNFETVEAQIAAKAAQGVGVASATLIPPNQLQFQLTDHSYLPPIILPTATFRFVGVWTPSTPYLVNDIFSEGPSGYVVLVQHTSDTTFDPNATDGSAHNLYGVFFSSPSELPLGGGAGAVLTKHSLADYDAIWIEPTLADLTDVDQTRSPTTGQAVYWNGSVFSYGSFLPLGGGAVAGPVDLIAQPLTQTGGSLAIDRAQGEVARVSLTANITAITVTHWPPSGVLGKVTLLATNGGAFTMSGWPSGTVWAAGTAPVLTPSGTDVFVLMSLDGGTTIYGSIAGQNYS
jgi:hypothetical protein